MKQLIIFLLLLSSVVQAQRLDIDLTPYAKKTDLQSLENRIKVLESELGKPPVVTKKDCKRGPTITKIYNITSSGFEAQFDADSVVNMKYMVTGSKVYIDSLRPTKNTFAVVFPTQFPNGVYTFSIEGINCNGSNSRTFTIAGGVDPPSSKDCAIQPTFNINGFTNQAATIQFNARKLEVLTLKVVQGSNTFKSTTYKPDVNTLFFPFDQTLPAGNYKITLTPVSCTAEIAVQEFTIKDEGTGEIPPIEENNDIPKFSVTPKNLFKLKNTSGVYEDVTPGDYIGTDGARYRKENGIIYRSLYWISELPLLKDGKPTDFGKQKLPNGILAAVRKEYAAVDWTEFANNRIPANNPLLGKSMPWRGAVSQDAFLTSGWDIWLHNGENKDAKSEYLFRTVVANFTTNGGRDLKTGEGFVRQQNSSYLDAGNLVPQFVFNPAKNRSDKPVVIQCYPTLDSPYETVKALYDGGVTHVWWQNLHGAGGIYVNGQQAVGADKYPITPGFNWSSNEFKQRFPRLNFGDQLTDEECLEFANSIYIGNNFVLTDEWSEGSFPQMSDRRNIIYRRVGERVKESGLTGVELLGDYGYGSKNLNFLNSSVGRFPMNKYYIDLLGVDGKQKLEQVGGSGHTTVKNDYWENGQSNFRGTVVGAYYAITFQSADLIPSMTYEAMLFNNMFPDQPKQRFTTPIMQSNAHGADVPYKNDGTIKADGTENLGQYPEAPAELLKINSFNSLLYFNSAYLWDAYGTKPAKDKNLWYDSSIMTDAWIEGTRWYANLVPYLNQANREMILTDYKVNGKKFTSKTTERRISNSGKTYFNNIYINEVVDQKVGYLTRIPANKNVFIYCNSYKLPSEIEEVTAVVDGKEYYLGEVAGSTLNVFYEK